MLRRLFAALPFVLLLAARPALAERVIVPVDVGVGPAGLWWTGAVADDQPVHTGIKLSIAAVIDNAMIRKYIHKVPPKYRAHALRMDEFRYRPSIFIPDSVILSPKVARTGIYGVTWRPLGIQLPLAPGRTTSFDLQAGLLLTYAFLHSDALAVDTLHFLRPGIDVGFRWEIPVTPQWLVSLGWASQLYLPQEIGGEFGAIGPFDERSVWHVGQAFLMLHRRFGYAVDI